MTASLGYIEVCTLVQSSLPRIKGLKLGKEDLGRWASLLKG